MRWKGTGGGGASDCAGVIATEPATDADAADNGDGVAVSLAFALADRADSDTGVSTFELEFAFVVTFPVEVAKGANGARAWLDMNRRTRWMRA
jgi:hypothetical protein